MIADDTLRRWFSRHTVALTGDLIRVFLWALVVVGWLFYVQPYLKTWRQIHTATGANDFTIFYESAKAVADGRSMYEVPSLRGTATANTSMNLNPPHFNMLLRPLASLPYGQAFIMWSALNVFALVTSVAIIVRTLNIAITPSRLAAWGVLVIASTPFTSTAATAEWSFILLLPFTIAWSCTKHDRWHYAGWWLGCCMSLKLFFLLFLPWLVLRGRWRSAAWAIVAMLVWTSAGLLWSGPGSYLQWVLTLGSVEWWWHPMNASWQGFVWRLLRGGGAIAGGFAAEDLARPISVAGAALISAVSLWAASRLSRTSDSTDAGILVLLCGSLLASPLGWVYYVPLALGPLVAVLWTRWWQRVDRFWLGTAAIAIVGLYVPLENVRVGQPSAWASITVTSSYFWGLFLLWLTLVNVARIESAGPALADRRPDAVPVCGCRQQGGANT